MGSDRPSRQVIAWVLATLVGLFFLSMAWDKLVDSERMAATFAAWGYGPGLLTVVGAVEAVGGLMLLVPALTVWGALLLTPVLCGALYTHLATGSGSPLLPILTLAALAVVAWLRRGRALGLKRPHA